MFDALDRAARRILRLQTEAFFWGKGPCFLVYIKHETIGQTERAKLIRVSAHNPV